MKTSSLLTLLLYITTANLAAQEQLAISEAEFERLAIVFSPAVDADARTGNHFPATVISSPDTASVVTAPYAGNLNKWHIQPGSGVKPGEALATMRSQDILDIQKDWLIAISENEHARISLERDQKLLEQGIISGQRLQQTQREFRQTQLALETAAHSLDAAGFNDMEKQTLQEGQTGLGIYTLRATVAGTLTHRAYKAGEYIEAYSEVATVHKDGPPWLSATVPARLGTALSSGHPLSIAHTDHSLTLRQRDHEVDSTTQTVEILAEFDDNVDYLPGQVLTVLLPPVEQGVYIPSDAVVHSGDETTVFVRSENGVEARILDLHPAGNNYLARSGIAPGEEVVVQGASVLKGMQLGLGGE